MKEELFQTLHPVAGKTNKKIALSKYLLVKEHLIAILGKSALSHTALMESLYNNIKDNFEGGIQWYGEVVKLDLEARGIIERTGNKPALYKLTTTTANAADKQ